MRYIQTHPKPIARPVLSITLALLLPALAGCISVPPSSSYLKTQAERFEPSPNRANIYVFRSYNSLGSLLYYETYLDYRWFGTLVGDTYLFGEIPAGNHVLQCFARNSKPALLAFTAEEGRNYYFKLGPGVRALSLKSVEEAQARAWVSEFQLSGDNVFEYLSETPPP